MVNAVIWSTGSIDAASNEGGVLVEPVDPAVFDPAPAVLLIAPSELVVPVFDPPVVDEEPMPSDVLADVEVPEALTTEELDGLCDGSHRPRQSSGDGEKQATSAERKSSRTRNGSRLGGKLSPLAP